MKIYNNILHHSVILIIKIASPPNYTKSDLF